MSSKMIIEKVIIVNYKSFKGIFELPLNEDINIIVGDNEAGKSTILEAINLALTGQLNGRSIANELSPYLFNYEVVQEYIAKIIKKEACDLPEIKIEIYLKAHDDLAEFSGTNNTKKVNQPGFYIDLRFNDEYCNEYNEYIKDAQENIKTIPIEYYEVKWFAFSNEAVTARSIPANVSLIDTTATRFQNGADIYISKIIRDLLDDKEKAELAINHRKLKELFASEKSIQAINEKLHEKKGEVSEKKLKLCVDVSSKTNWETTLTAHLDDIPFHFIGKGEQNSVKMKLALENNNAKKSSIILIEEPENHLSYSNMNKLINKISEKCEGKQLIITTHSSFVLNKLGLEKLILLGSNKKVATLTALRDSTQKYFKKLPGYDTLRVLLSEKPILVEGPSDELIIQKAFFQKHGKLPVEAGIDIISVRGLSFKRFLEIAKLLEKEIWVVRDNDGKTRQVLEDNYKDFIGVSKVCFDDDTACKTLEPQMVKSNSLESFNKILETHYADPESLVQYMVSAKTDWALKMLESPETIVIPQYIQDAL